MSTRSARKRSAIIQAAIDEFQAHGFQGANMDNIAQTAEVSKRTVYNHFPSKQSLFETIAEQAWQALNQASSIQYEAERPLAQQLTQLIFTQLTLLADDNFLRLARILIGEFIHNQVLAQNITETFKPEESALNQWIESAQQHRHLPIQDTEQAAKHLHSLIKAYGFWPQLVMGEAVLSTQERQDCAQAICTQFLSLYPISTGVHHDHLG